LIVVELIITDLFLHHLLYLPAVLLLLFSAFLHWDIVTVEPILHRADRSHVVDLGLVAELPRDRLTVRCVGVMLGLPVPGAGLQLANLLWFQVAVLPLHWLRGGVGELLTITLGLGFAELLSDISWSLVTRILRSLPADSLLTVAAISPLLLLAVEVEGVLAGDVVNHEFTVLAVFGFYVATFEIILVRHLNIESSVAHIFLDDGALLDMVLLLDGVVLDVLMKAADELIDGEANPLDLGGDGASAVPVGNLLAVLHILGKAGLLGVRLALVLIHDLLLHVAVLTPAAVTIVVGHQLRFVDQLFR